MSKPLIILVSSGKGGVGKSIFCSCAAQILGATFGKTILVDADLAVKGSTFLHGRVEHWKEHPAPLISYLRGDIKVDYLLENAQSITSDTDFIPAECDFSKEQVWPQLLDVEELFVQFFDACEVLEYKYVVIDSRAGADKLFLGLANLANRVVLIAEPDEISLDTALDMRGQIRRESSRDVSTHILINKAPRGYRRSSKDSVLRSLNFLPLIPYDETLHRRFVEDARALVSSGFKRTPYRRFVGRVLDELLRESIGYAEFARSLPRPGFLDHVRLNKTLLYMPWLIVLAASAVTMTIGYIQSRNAVNQSQLQLLDALELQQQLFERLDRLEQALEGREELSDKEEPDAP